MHEARRRSSSSSARRALRDQLVSVRKAIERQQMVGAKEEDFDVIGIADDALEASVQVFYVRKGRVVGRKGLVVDKVEDVDPPELVGRAPRAALRRRAGPTTSPARCSCPIEPDDVELYEEFLSLTPRRRRCGIRVPQRGAKRELLADRRRRTREEAFARHKLKRASDHNARARALLALQEALDLPEAPLRIECFDISNLQGTEIVASMVVMEDGLPKRSDYRRFKITPPGRPGRLRRDGGGADPALPPLPRRARRGRAGRASGSRTRRTCCSSTAARASSASRCACSRSSGSRTSASSAWPSGSRRCTCPAAPSRCASRATPRRCTCSSRCATRPTASRSRTTASCATRR